MPIYEYKCEACGHHLEVLQKLSEAPLTQCPECGKPALHKQMSAAGFRLKGGGWYETDFKSGNKRNVIGEGEKPATESMDKAESKDKKPSPEKQTAEPAKETTAKKAEAKPESKPKAEKAAKAD